MKKQRIKADDSKSEISIKAFLHPILASSKYNKKEGGRGWRQPPARRMTVKI